MLLRKFHCLSILAVLSTFAVPSLVNAAQPSPCVTADQASKMLNKDICISAHIYDVVQLPDGTRFLDICSPQTSDDDCHFTILSPWEDRDLVGELTKYRDMEVQVRGIVQPMHGRAGMILSHTRQFHGGPPRFKPNPQLARGFNAEEERRPIRDPNLHTQGSARAFMNTRDREPMPAK